MEKKIICILAVLGIFGWYISFQVDSYRLWIKADAISDFETCMFFRREDKDGEEHCKKYAKGPGYTPYPFWKPLIFINPITSRTP